jgi:hypothetical protein
MRDTGEVLNDLSLPIFINGRHWGACIIGCRPEILITWQQSSILLHRFTLSGMNAVLSLVGYGSSRSCLSSQQIPAVLLLPGTQVFLRISISWAV